MRGRRWLLVGWVVLGACARSTPAPAPRATAAPAPAVAQEPPAPTPAPMTTTTPTPLTATATGAEGTDQPEGSLVGEAPERDPRSETVTIKIVTEPRRQAHVVWGRKDLGPTPLEIVRPRGSGPLDLVLIAPGYLPLHTRAFTDRDDTITLRLYGENEGPTLLGYRP